MSSFDTTQIMIIFRFNVFFGNHILFLCSPLPLPSGCPTPFPPPRAHPPTCLYFNTVDGLQRLCLTISTRVCLSILLIPHIYPSLSLVLNCLIPSLHTQFIILFPLLSSPCIGFRRARNLFKAAHINKHPGYNINQVGTFYHLSQQAVDSPELDILKSTQKEKLSQILTA